MSDCVALILIYHEGHDEAASRGRPLRPPPVPPPPRSTHQNHLRKLERIRQERRSQLQQGHSVDLASLKDRQSRSFAHKFNTANYQIAQSNLRFLVKLEKVKPHTSHAPAERPPPAFPSALAKRRIIETERENSRIFLKMKSVSSNLSRDRMGSEYAKAEKIKSRITRYAVENNRVALKYPPAYTGPRSTSAPTRPPYPAAHSRTHPGTPHPGTPSRPTTARRTS